MHALFGFQWENRMNAVDGQQSQPASGRDRYEIRFQPLFQEGCALSFACDQEGHVNLDHLSEAARNDYFFARAMVGRSYGMPLVQAYWPVPMRTNGAQKYGAE